MRIAVLIADENRNDYVVSPSLSIQKVYGEPWTCDFETVDEAGAYYPNVGEPVQVVMSEYIVDQLAGDGSTQTFELSEIPASIDQIVINFNSLLPQTLGVYGVDTGKQWYWEVGTANIHQEPGDPPLEPPDYIDTAYDRNIIVFGGLVRTVDRFKEGSFMDLLRTRVSCTDWNQILERRLTGERVWLGKTCAEIITDINNDYLDGDGFTVADIDPGPTLDSFQVDFAVVADALNELRSLATTDGAVYQLYIDEEKRFVFRLDEAIAASITIPDDADNLSNLVVRETDEDYTNYVVGRVGESLRPEQTETLETEGDEAFQLAFPVAATPTITVNGVPNTVGVASVDEDRDWYWSKGSREIRQNSENTPVTSLDEVVVTYVGIESIYVLAKDDSQIAARAAIELGSGRHDKLIEIDQLLSRGDAQTIVDGYLYSHLNIPLVATISTSDHLEPQARNLKPGTFLTILQAGWATSEDPYTVRSIKMTAEPRPGTDYNQFVYEIEAFKGSRTKTVFQWFKDRAGSGNAIGAAGSHRNDVDTEFIHFFLAGCDALAAGDDVAAHRPHLHSSGTVVLLSSDCKTAPTSELRFDIKRSIDDGTTWESIFVAGYANHPADSLGVVFYSNFADASKGLMKGTKFRVDVVTAGGAQGWALKLAVKRIVTDPGQMAGDGGNATGITGVSMGAPLAVTVV